VIRLNSVSRIEAVCDFAANTVDPTCVTCWSDQSTGAYQGGALSQNFTGTTAIVIVAAPASGAVRDVDFINISNVDLITQAITVRYYNGSGTYNLVKVTLASGDRLTYTHAAGWQTITSAGVLKSAGATGLTGATGTIGPSMAFEHEYPDEGLAMTYGPAGLPTISGTLRDFLHTPTSANLAAAVTNETGSGALVFGTTPTLTTPVINTVASVGGAWTAAATWTLPAHTLGGTVSGGGNQLNNVVIGTVTPLAGFFTSLSASGIAAIGGSTSADRLLNISGPITGGVNAYGVMINGTVQSGVTSGVYLYRTAVSVVDAAFTLPSLFHFYATKASFGASATVTLQAGFTASSAISGAASNYGFFGNLVAGAGSYNCYMSGSAPNYFAGDMQLDKTVTAAGTTTPQTIDKNAGAVNFAAADASKVVTDSRVTANSIIVATVATNDATMKSVQAVAAAGSFTLYANAAATAEARVNFLVIN
jgi:hypothetical protein